MTKSLEKPNENTFLEKKSRFIAYAFPFSSVDEFESILEGRKSLFPDARHHCWAFRYRDNNGVLREKCHDDGEPSSTAGMPLLNLLQYGDLQNAAIIVSRYFGGIKLGAGGLTRAYSQSGREVLASSNIIDLVIYETYEMTCDFSDEALIRHEVEKLRGQVLEVDYRDRVSLLIKLPCGLEKTLSDLNCASMRITLNKVND